jgi:hypothetical protein
VKASTLGFKQVIVDFPVFRYQFECIIGPKKNVGKYVAFHLNYTSNKEALEITTQRGRFYYSHGNRSPIVWLPKFPQTPREYGDLSHEIGHAVIDMLEYIGAPIDRDNDETFCYAHGYAMEKILEAKRGR